MTDKTMEIILMVILAILLSISIGLQIWGHIYSPKKDKENK